MFTTSGIGVIPKTIKESGIVERQAGSGIYITFPLVTKDPYKEGRHYLRISMYVPSDNIEVAREAIQPGQGVQIRIGEVTGRQLDTGYIAMEIRTKWHWIEALKALPGPEKKKDT